MAIQDLLSLNFLVPFVANKLDFKRAIRGLRGMPRRLLLVGHKLAAGSVAINTLVTVSTETDAIERFGEGSMLLAMWRAAKANADLGLPIDCIAIAPGNTPISATTTIVIANTGGTVAVPGEVMLYIHGKRVSVGVTTSDTDATVATKLIAAIAAQPSLQVTAAAGTNPGEVKLTAKWGGPTGNSIDVRGAFYDDDRLPNGLTMTIPAMALGAVNPDVSPVIAAIGLSRPTEIVCPFLDSANLNLFETELAARWEANNMRDGMVVNAMRGTESEITTFLGGRNSPHVHTIATTKDVTNPWETAAMAGAAIESQASKDPAVPHTGIPLLGYVGPKPAQHWTIDQINNLLQAGASPLEIGQDSTGNLLRMVTNYTLSSAGAPDRSMAELCWLKTASYKRWFNVTEFQTKYRGYKLAQYITDPIPGQKIMTVPLAEEIMLGIYKTFMDAGLCQNMGYYKDTLLVEIDGANQKLKIIDQPVLVVQHYQTEITSEVVGGTV
ncbi:phage tail sheath gpL-like [Variovorax boronicumulans]|uniref:phage tail sheath subtilisin-like domain-containing protein n=1 Tax=Variovorax boronicumulans TaxID=436515 RepID=UPI0027879621|nr:phage tail sheath subtilisin-like domain-containing protein [Variovorax boronicumulans]MDP9990882.1 phage tail sheath gpL-like [Variovorax boronicumulans]MDQ0002910.1 phage tail sheath gpL-like [Variovorax boronicumulans]